MKRDMKRTLLIFCMAGMVLIGCGNADDKAFEKSTQMSSDIKQTVFSETLELGKDFELNVEDYFDITGDVRIDDIVIDSQTVDKHNVGQYIASATYNGNRYEIAVSVVDTTSPKLSVKNEVKSVDFGSIINPRDYVEIDDEDETDLYFVTEEGDKKEIAVSKDFDITIKEIDYNIVAVDLSGNRSEETQITIPIVHNFSNEIINEKNDNQVYELDQFICETCGLRYIESALDDIVGENIYDTELDKYTVEDIEKRMVTTQACNVRTGPSVEFNKVGNLATSEVVVVTGYCEEENWYRIKKDDDEIYISGDYLSDVRNNKISSNVNDRGGYENESKITQAQSESANDAFTGEETNLDELPTIDWNDIVPGQPAFLWDEATSSWVLNPYYRDIGENWY